MTLHADARKLNWSMIGVIVALIVQAAVCFLAVWRAGRAGVASITDNGTGDYTLNLSNTFGNANDIILFASHNGAGGTSAAMPWERPPAVFTLTTRQGYRQTRTKLSSSSCRPSSHNKENP
jgi:hypothetical protein